MIQGLTRAINSFSNSAETQAKPSTPIFDKPAVGDAVIRIMQEIRATEAARASADLGLDEQSRPMTLGSEFGHGWRNIQQRHRTGKAWALTYHGKSCSCWCFAC
jgi:hypothetical protein